MQRWISLSGDREIITIPLFLYFYWQAMSAFSILLACLILTAYHHGREVNPPEVPGNNN